MFNSFWYTKSSHVKNLGVKKLIFLAFLAMNYPKQLWHYCNIRGLENYLDGFYILITIICRHNIHPHPLLSCFFVYSKSRNSYRMTMHCPLISHKFWRTFKEEKQIQTCYVLLVWDVWRHTVASPFLTSSSSSASSRMSCKVCKLLLWDSKSSSSRCCERSKMSEKECKLCVNTSCHTTWHNLVHIRRYFTSLNGGGYTKFNILFFG